jgi:hypothetical protein
MFAAWGAGRELPTAPDRLIPQKALDGVNTHRLILLGAIASRFARVVTDAAHDGR